MEGNRAAALRAFAAYVRGYDPRNPKISLKILHTYRVADLCDTLAQSLGLPAETCDLYWLAGLLHDVGRFEQVRRYGTFDDAASVDHAAESVRVLFRDGHIRDYLPDPAQDAALETAIGLHSVYRLPAGLAPDTLRLCQVLRDADKLDIFRVGCETPLAELCPAAPGVARTALVSPAVMAAFAAHRAVLRTEKHTPPDTAAAMAALAFELVFPASVRIARGQGYLFRLLDYGTDNPATAAQFAEMRRILAAALDAADV
jgi:hypothetical protein